MYVGSKLSYFSIGWYYGETHSAEKEPDLDHLLCTGHPSWAKSQLVSGFLAGQTYGLDKQEQGKGRKKTKSVLEEK